MKKSIVLAGILAVFLSGCGSESKSGNSTYVDKDGFAHTIGYNDKVEDSPRYEIEWNKTMTVGVVTIYRETQLSLEMAKADAEALSGNCSYPVNIGYVEYADQPYRRDYQYKFICEGK